MTVSNRRPPTCKDGALPTELIAHRTDFDQNRELGRRHLCFTTRGLVVLAFWISYVNTSARPISAWTPPRHLVKMSVLQYTKSQLTLRHYRYLRPSWNYLQLRNLNSSHTRMGEQCPHSPKETSTFFCCVANTPPLVCG